MPFIKISLHMNLPNFFKTTASEWQSKVEWTKTQPCNIVFWFTLVKDCHRLTGFFTSMWSEINSKSTYKLIFFIYGYTAFYIYIHVCTHICLTLKDKEQPSSYQPSSPLVFCYSCSSNALKTKEQRENKYRRRKKIHYTLTYY